MPVASDAAAAPVPVNFRVVTYDGSGPLTKLTSRLFMEHYV